MTAVCGLMATMCTKRGSRLINMHITIRFPGDTHTQMHTHTCKHTCKHIFAYIHTQRHTHTHTHSIQGSSFSRTHRHTWKHTDRCMQILTDTLAYNTHTYHPDPAYETIDFVNHQDPDWHYALSQSHWLNLGRTYKKGRFVNMHMRHPLPPHTHA